MEGYGKETVVEKREMEERKGKIDKREGKIRQRRRLKRDVEMKRKK